MMSVFRRIPTVAVLTVAMATLAAAPADAWKGSEETVDGVLHVKNPSEAIDPPMTIELDEVYRLGGWDGGEDEFFGVISDMLVDDDGNVYLLDAQLSEIKIYDPDGNFLNTIGRAGEGPGEFRGGNRMFWMPNGDIAVNQVFPGRVVTLSKDGTPGEDFRINAGPEGEMRILFSADNAGENIAVVYGTNSFDQATGKWGQIRTLAIFGANGEEQHALTQADLGMNMNAPVITEAMFDGFWNRMMCSDDGRLVYAPKLHEYELVLANADGKVDRVIHREYPEHKRTQEQIDETLEVYKGFTQQIPAPNKTYEIEDVHPPIDFGGVFFRPDGSLWVSVSRGSVDAPDDQVGLFDVYDPKGRFVRQVTLKGDRGDGDAVFFVGDRIYVITEFLNAAMAAQGGGANAIDEEEEAEPMSVICYRSSDLDRAASIPGGPADSR